MSGPLIDRDSVLALLDQAIARASSPHAKVKVLRGLRERITFLPKVQAPPAVVHIVLTPFGEPFAVFSTPERAKRYAEHNSQPGAVCRVEEWTVDAEVQP